MARGFRRKGHGGGIRFIASLDDLERAMVAGLMEQVHDLLEPPARVEPDAGGDEFDAIVAGLALGPSVAAEGLSPDRGGGGPDPALDRLLPTAHREDDEVASEFRRLTEAGLRTRKAAALGSSAALLRGADQVRLDRGGAVQFLTALTDVRLVLGERMGLRTDEDVELMERAASSLDAEDPLVHALAVYDFLTWLQETLASAMLDT
ncbi:MAG: DUF2017 domain-containing protein [Phycicoccus sp.]